MDCYARHADCAAEVILHGLRRLRVQRRPDDRHEGLLIQTLFINCVVLELALELWPVPRQEVR